RSGVPPWSPDALPYGSDEIAAMVDQGLQNNSPLDFEVRSYSADLVPAQSLFPTAGRPDPEPLSASRQNAVYYTWADDPDSTWTLGLMNQGEKPVTVRANLWAEAEAEEAPVFTAQIE